MKENKVIYFFFKLSLNVTFRLEASHTGCGGFDFLCDSTRRRLSSRDFPSIDILHLASSPLACRHGCRVVFARGQSSLKGTHRQDGIPVLRLARL